VSVSVSVRGPSGSGRAKLRLSRGFPGGLASGATPQEINRGRRPRPLFAWYAETLIISVLHPSHPPGPQPRTKDDDEEEYEEDDEDENEHDVSASVSGARRAQVGRSSV
jgi:hypothetical protein